MPNQPPAYCSTSGCPHLTTTPPRCPTCQQQQQQQWKQRSSKIYNTRRWTTTRQHQLRQHPWCEWTGCREIATDVDHIIPINAGGDAWSTLNLQSLCHPHHSKKTAHETIRPRLATLPHQE